MIHSPKVFPSGTSLHNQTLLDSVAGNHSNQNNVLPTALRRPGEAVVPLIPSHDLPPPAALHKRRRKCKQTPSPDRAAVGGYGPINKSSEQVTVCPSSTVKLTERRNATYDVWAFVRSVETKDDTPIEWWPDDYDEHLTRRLDTPFIGCKFCTRFG